MGRLLGQLCSGRLGRNTGYSPIIKMSCVTAHSAYGGPGGDDDDDIEDLNFIPRLRMSGESSWGLHDAR
jgi:hypothetical protein